MVNIDLANLIHLSPTVLMADISAVEYKDLTYIDTLADTMNEVFYIGSSVNVISR